MPLFMIERNFAESLNPSAADLKAIGDVNALCAASNGCIRFFPRTSARHIACMKRKTGMPFGRRQGVPDFLRISLWNLRASCDRNRRLHRDFGQKAVTQSGRLAEPRAHQLLAGGSTMAYVCLAESTQRLENVRSLGAGMHADAPHATQVESRLEERSRWTARPFQPKPVSA